MATGSALPTAGSEEIYVGSEISDYLSLLDVVHANQFEGEYFDPQVLEQTEEDFYRGAPPKWLNFHICEQIKRDGYDTLVKQIHQRRKRPGISRVKLFHQPGCGGTTLAMQVLWDLRKTFRSAVLTGSTSDITNVAKEVVHLFTAGSQGRQNTVLLLVNDEHILENLQESIMIEIAEQKVVTRNAAVIFLCCVRKDAVPQSDHVVLKKVLSDTEQQKFNGKKDELMRRFKKTCKHFHGFNIMQTNFSQDYIQEACTIFRTIKRINKPKTQLVAVLSLLNACVPGSYLLESQCLDFLKHGDPFNENPSLEDRMNPFSDLIVTFQQDMRSGTKVRMAHSLIAQYCTELLYQAGATRGNTARNILNGNGNGPLKDLISRKEVERKCAFLEKFLTYSKPNMKKDDPSDSYISECYSKYVGDTPFRDDGQRGSDFMQKLKQKLVDPSTGVPSFLDREFTESELKPISTWWEEIFLRSSCKSSTAFREQMPLRSKDTPELHLVTLLLSWPTESEDMSVVDLSELIQCMHHAYDNTYKRYLRSRYLRPLFFMGKGQDLNRIVHGNVLEGLFPEQDKDTTQGWGNEKVFRDPNVQAHLLQVKGVVRNYRVYATIGVKEIQVDANLRNSLFITGHVSFYLGFTIRGPVALGIQKLQEKASEGDIKKPGQMTPDLSAWTDTTTGQHFVDRHQTALINRVSDTASILAKLKEKGLISKDNCDAVSRLQTTQDQMTDILKFVSLAGPTGKEALHNILKGMRSMRPLILELEESG